MMTLRLFSVGAILLSWSSTPLHAQEFRGVSELGGTPKTVFSEEALESAYVAQFVAQQLIKFAGDSLGIRAEVTIAVLDESAWTANDAPVSYGVPWTSGTTVVTSATPEGILFDAYAPLFVQFPDEAGIPLMNQFLRELSGLLLREVPALRDIPPWLSEFLSSYLTYLSVRPYEMSLTAAFHALPSAYLDAVPAPPNPSLAAFDSEFERLQTTPSALVWYQSKFDQLSVEAGTSLGSSLLRDVARIAGSAPDGSPPSWVAELQRLIPGFQAWAQGLSP